MAHSEPCYRNAENMPVGFVVLVWVPSEKVLEHQVEEKCKGLSLLEIPVHVVGKSFVLELAQSESFISKGLSVIITLFLIQVNTVLG